MASTIITSYLGEGLLANRPATPSLAANAIGFWYSTDTTTLSVYANGGWSDVGGAAPVSEPSIEAFTTIPANPGFDTLFASAAVFSNSNKTVTPSSGTPYNYFYGSHAHYAGKKYFEFVPGSTSFSAFGLAGAAGHGLDHAQAGFLNFGRRLPGQIGWESDGTVRSTQYPGSSPVLLTTIATWSATNVLSVAVDIDALKVWFRVGAGNWNNSGSADPATGVGAIDGSWLLTAAANKLIWPGCNCGNTTNTTLRLLSADFTQSVPSGFSAWGIP